MPITSIRRDWGVAPSGVRISSTDSIAAVQVAGYMDAQAPVIAELNGGVFGFVPGDLVMVSASDGSEVFNFTGDDFATLVPNSGGGGGGVTSTQVQQSAFNTGLDSGVADAYVVTLSPAVTAYTQGLMVTFVANADNITVTPTLDAGAGTNQIVLLNGALLAAGDINTGVTCWCIYLNGNFALLNPLVSIVTVDNIANNDFIKGPDSGAADAYIYTNTLAANTLASGEFIVLVNVLNSNTGASTLNVNGLGPLAILLPNGTSLAGGEILFGGTYLFLLGSAGSFILMNSSVAVTPRSIQYSSYTKATDTGAVNAYAAILSPAIIGGPYPTGLIVNFKPVATNTITNPTLKIEASPPFGATTIKLVNGDPLLPGDLDSNTIAQVLIAGDGGSFISAMYLLNPIKSFAPTKKIQNSSYNTGGDTGAADAYAVALTPAITAYTDGLQVSFTPANANTIVAPTLAVNGLAAKTIVKSTGALLVNSLVTSMIAVCVYSSAADAFVLITPAL